MEEFLDNLKKSNLLAPEQWQTVRREALGDSGTTPPRAATANEAAPSTIPSPQELAGRLVERGWITRWQADMLLKGKRAFFLGKYKLLDCIGAGGMGAVFKAVHLELGRTVAIKIMSAAVVKDRRAVARFHHEIQAVAALDHPQIVAAFDAGAAGGVHFLVMEFAEGHDLGYLLKQSGPMNVGWACECIRQAAQGLQYVHEKGMVHRDIKPTNLLVARDRDSGRPIVKILDLGLARLVGERSAGDDGSITQIGQFLGTPEYISPEQAFDTRSADIRSDIFSLGCTLFRLLTGELPFPGETVAQKLAARETTDALRLRELRPDMPAELDDVVARMLAREPNSRFQTPREVARALASFAVADDRLAAFSLQTAKEPRGGDRLTADLGAPQCERDDSRLAKFLEMLGTKEAAGALSVSGLAQRLTRIRQRTWLAAAALSILGLAGVLSWHLLAAATLVVAWPLDEREGAQLRVDRRAVKLPSQDEITITGRPGNWALRLSRDGYETIETSIALNSGQRQKFAPVWRPTQRTIRRLKLEELDAGLTAPAADILSPEAIGLRAELSRLIRDHAASREAAQARKLASRIRWPLDLLNGQGVSGDETAPFAEQEHKTPFDLVAVFGDGRLKFWNTVTALAAGSDGELLAGAGRDGTVQIFDRTDGRTRHLLQLQSLPVDVAFSPAAAILAIAEMEGPVTLWDAGNGALLATLRDAFSPMAFSFDGMLIAARAARGEMALFDVPTGELRRTMQGHSTGIVQGLTFSHRGKMLASYGSDASVLLWDVSSGQERRRFPNTSSGQFSPDDDYLAAGASNGDLILWDTRTGEKQRSLEGGGQPLAFRDAATLVSKRLGRAVVWDLATGEEIRTIVQVPELAAVSPNGKWLAGGDESFGELRVWSLSAATAPMVVSSAGPITSLAFTPDSSTVIAASRDNLVQMWQADSGVESAKGGLPLSQADLSPDGRILAVRQGTKVELWDLTTGEVELVLAEDATEIESLAFSPGGRLLAGFGGWGFFKTSLRLWDSSNGEELLLVDDAPGAVRAVSFSPDAQLLAAAGDGRLVTVWGLAQRTVQHSLDGFSDRVSALAFHPDGRRLAVACHDRTLVLWDLKAGKGKKFATEGAVCRQLVFSPDGRWLAGSADARVLVWSAERGTVAAELATGPTAINSIAFSPVENTLLAAGDDGRLWQWNDPARERRRAEPDRLIRLGPAHGVVRRATYSPDGRHIVTVNGNGTVYVVRLSREPTSSP
ncbi:MAG TPA: serine/threonine-protein kinase [Planctomycetaceae bacterium]|nr:serine/threonine-protein kinase [Planctomycetaceae bacterium]